MVLILIPFAIIKIIIFKIEKILCVFQWEKIIGKKNYKFIIKKNVMLKKIKIKKKKKNF